MPAQAGIHVFLFTPQKQKNVDPRRKGGDDEQKRGKPLHLFFFVTSASAGPVCCFVPRESNRTWMPACAGMTNN
jgi:hypothetical protein